MWMFTAHLVPHEKLHSQRPLGFLRLWPRFLLPLAATVAVIGFLGIALVDRLLTEWFVHDLAQHGERVVSMLREPLARARALGAPVTQVLEQQARRDGRTYVLGLCDAAGRWVYATAAPPQGLACESAAPALRELPSGAKYLSFLPLGDEAGIVVLMQDAGFIAQRSAEVRGELAALLVLMSVLITLIAALIALLSWRGWLAKARDALNSRRFVRQAPAGEPPSAVAPEVPEVDLLLRDVQALVHEVEQERRQRDEQARDWTPETLRRLLHEQLAGDEIIVVSNREPYLHVRTPGGVAVRRPASGLVTAVEPVMRACSGTWIAHGSGSADRAMADAEGRVPVPPQAPSYTLKRIWLTKQEERGYYYGFANEGLWPLCHIAHVRPVFRLSDWETYGEVNRRFAYAVCQAARTPNPVVLVQDYHLALVPRLIRERLPQATIISFWHIPWPNVESFGICPWRAEILDGLLGSTIVGFHTRSHCAHFVDAVDRYLETRVEREHSTVYYGGQMSRILPYPISIAWPSDEARQDWPSLPECRAALRARLNLPDDHLIGLGVDRLDYTKGIVERLQAVERALEKYPELVGQFSFVQIAAPSRSSLEAYQSFEARVRAVALAINERFGEGSYQPVHLLIEHHDSESVLRHYRGSDVCVVTSLHDGMNLVAKEFVAARDDEQGVLVLSQFAGAAGELAEALIVNPYHVEETADALHRALSMPTEEQRLRMRSLRAQVRDFNVYRWAGRMLMDAARLRERERLAERIDEQRALVAAQ
jgi:trehalose 6-phosphate synthase/phosphatase